MDSATLMRLRYISLIRQMAAERNEKYGWQSEVGRLLKINQSYVSKLFHGGRTSVGMDTIEAAIAALPIRRDFFTDPGPIDLPYTDYVGSQASHVEYDNDLRESFQAWKSIAPPGLTPVIEAEMLAMGHKAPPENAYQWSHYYDIVRASHRPPRPGEHIPGEEENAEADAEMERLGIKKAPPKKGRR